MSNCKMIRNITIIWLIFYNKCFCISDEYYNDDFLENNNNNNVTVYDNSSARRTVKDQPPNQFDIELNNYFLDPDILPKQYNFKNNDENVTLSYKVVTQKETHATAFVGGLEDKYTSVNNKIDNLNNNRYTEAIPKFILDLKFFRDYDYTLDTKNHNFSSTLLRHETNQKFKNESKSDHLNQSVIMKSPYTKFYNLEPAINHVTKIEIDKNLLPSNVWYVPQEFPCWELPVIYGELGVKQNKSDIFLIYGGNLVNVLDNWTESHNSYKIGDSPVSHIVNKWCGLQPCYADHTLCLFPNSIVSNVCDKGYKVQVPTVMNQITIISTINSMRNRVAHGLVNNYSHLRTAANMNQVDYDYDLEKMAEAWLRQCLPGSAPCSALDGLIVSQLECTKYMKYCCQKNLKASPQCTPTPECFVHPIIGCIHVWFSSAGNELSNTDVLCGRTAVNTFNAVQLLWAKTNKIGCAYGERSNGDIRVICQFSPGAPFRLDTKLFCGIIDHGDIEFLHNNENLTDLNFLASYGIKWNHIRIDKPRKIIPIDKGKNSQDKVFTTDSSHSHWGVDSLTKVYKEGWVRQQFDNKANGTRGLVARLVARYQFIDESESRCDSDESIYEVGPPGSSCIERSNEYDGLCYEFRELTTGFRVIAIAAPIALFSLILYDLFSGVIRQTNF